MNRSRLIIALIVGFLAATTGFLVQGKHLFHKLIFANLEAQSIDARFELRGKKKFNHKIVFVEFSDNSIALLNLPYPFPRRVHAQAMRELDRLGARAIGYDVQFSEPSNSPKDDRALKAAVQTTGKKLVLAFTEFYTDKTPALFFSSKELAQAGAKAGNVTFVSDKKDNSDKGGIIRKFAREPTGYPPGYNGYPTFAVALAQLSGEKAQKTISKMGNRQEWIDYAGPSQTVREVDFADLIQGKVDPRIIRDSIAVVGATVKTEQDDHPTPLDSHMPGTEIHANIVNTILNDLPLRDAPDWGQALIILFCSFLVPLLTLQVRAGWAIITGVCSTVLLTTILLLGAYIAFLQGTVITMTSGATSLFMCALGTVVAVYQVEFRQRRKMRQVFERFVPRDVVSEVLAKTEDDLRLGGKRLEATVMFCDLRGFTSYAETLSAERVIEILNLYLTEMSDAILDHGGTLVSYMGDGIMAVFGAPLSSEDHADNALAAAHEMLTVRLPHFNAAIQHEFRMGIGLNSGEVMSGNVGSQRRLEYTSVGDTTNTAARLEAMTKETPYQLLVATSTKTLLKHDPPEPLTDAGERAVRGRSASIQTWTFASESKLK